MIRRLTTSVRARLETRATVQLARRMAAVRCSPPIASFSFDDVPLSAYREGVRALEACGGLGTFYVAGRLIAARDGHEPMLGPEEILDLCERRHEIGCHTFAHRRAGGRETADIHADLDENARALGKVIPGVTLMSFAYPYGEVSLRLKRVAGSRFQTCRAIKAGVNAGAVDLALLRANAIYSTTYSSASIDALLARAVERQGWVIFYTHDVRSRPSAYGCEPEQLRWAIERAREAGLEILPVGEAVRQAVIEPAATPR